MNSESWFSNALRVALTACIALMMAGTASAQSRAGQWRIGASTGAYVPFSSLIRAADLDDTEISAGPAFSLEPQYGASDYVSIYASGVVAFGSIRLGSSIRPGIVGASRLVVLAGGTAGVVLDTDLFSDHVLPTLRIGGGFKWYGFDLVDAENTIRPTADIGIGFRGVGVGPIDVTAEIRYLPSSFDQSKLPTRGILAQDQRQNDVLFSIGFAIR